MDFTWMSRRLLPEGEVRRILRGPLKGLRYRVRTGFGIYFVLGAWERDAFKVAAENMRPNDAVFDVGANLGAYTLLASRRVGPRGLVVSFEPFPQAFEDLSFNVGLNSLSNVRCLPRAVSSMSGTVDFHPAGSTTGRIEEGGELKVEAVRLDDVEGPPANFIKIDVEGHESKVLEGAAGLLTRHRPTLLISLHTPVEDRAVGRILKELGYQAFRLSGEPVKAMLSGYPDPDGMQGTVLARPQ